MKTKEKRMILILILISAIIITVIAVVKNNNSNETKETVSSNIITEGDLTPEEEARANAEAIKSAIVDNEVEEEINETEIGEFVKQEDDGTIKTTSEKFLADREFEGFALENIELIQKNGETSFLATVINKTGKKQEEFWVNVLLYDKDGNELGGIPANIVPLEKDDNTPIYATVVDTYKNVYDFKLERTTDINIVSE